ncbi:unnamed protein product [Moneuplotes crassus]|uniref:Uncharacterized protein n=1 Tax=Euplotes crassus TaxID=5936 RepID=A0AAD1X754_EUPCR|nr:unnamed protein product [Moneuplotes crassus]
MHPIEATTAAIVNSYPVKYQRKKRFPDRDQHRLEHDEMAPDINNPYKIKSSYQILHSDLFSDEKRGEKARNLKNIQKTNPQVLPPAGKNFYDFNNRDKFIDAQKLGSMNLDSPSADYYNNSKFIQYKLTQNKKKTGKRMFNKNSSFNQNMNSPILFDSPSNAVMKYRQENGSENHLNSQSMFDRNKLSQKPPRNPMRHIRNNIEPPRDPATFNNCENPIERSRNNENRGSSMSRLGGQNYNNMIMNTAPAVQEDLENQSYHSYYEKNEDQNIQSANNGNYQQMPIIDDHNHNNLSVQRKLASLTPQRHRREPLELYNSGGNKANFNQTLDRNQNELQENTKVKVPVLNIQPRSQSQGGLGQLYNKSNPIAHFEENSQNLRRSGNLWQHQVEAKELQRRRQQMFLQGLNEQRKQEKQRRLIDQKYESIANEKIEFDKNNKIIKENRDREAFRRIFEEASHQNDLRVNHYLNNYYMPEKEKEIRNNIASTKASSGSGKRKIRIMKKKYKHPKTIDGVDRTNQDMNDENRMNEDLYQPHYQ